MHWYKRNIGEYHKKAGRLSMLQHGAYTLLLDACYDRERFPTLNEALDWTWASSDDEISAVKFVLSRFFNEDSEGRFVQYRIDEEVAKYQSNSANNKRIANEREAKRRENRTKRAQGVNEPPSNEHEAPPKQEPVNRKQETGTNNNKNLLSISIDDVMDHLNLITGKSFKRVESNSKLIRARLDEGHTVEDIKAVIDRQNAIWPVGDPFRQYMRPLTLFGATKFNQYVGELNQPLPEKANGQSQQSSRKRSHADEMREQAKRFMAERNTEDTGHGGLVIHQDGNVVQGEVKGLPDL